MNFADVVGLLRAEAKQPESAHFTVNEIGTLCQLGSFLSGHALDRKVHEAQEAGAFVGIEARNPRSVPPLSHYLVNTGGGALYDLVEWLRHDGDLPSTGTIKLNDIADALEMGRRGTPGGEDDAATTLAKRKTAALALLGRYQTEYPKETKEQHVQRIRKATNAGRSTVYAWLKIEGRAPRSERGGSVESRTFAPPKAGHIVQKVQIHPVELDKRFFQQLRNVAQPR